jgi:hypothetical protein
VAETCSPFDKPLLTPYYCKESCDLTVINKAYIVTLHNRMDNIKKCKLLFICVCVCVCFAFVGLDNKLTILYFISMIAHLTICCTCTPFYIPP